MSACILWDGPKNKAGYGYTRVGGRKEGVHRLALEKKLGRSLAAGEVARHKVCDNPSCINPAHIEPGSQADNIRDMLERGRHGGGARRGERNHLAKLSDADVLEIRSRIRFRASRGSGASAFDLAEEFDVSVHYLREVARGAERT